MPRFRLSRSTLWGIPGLLLCAIVASSASAQQTIVTGTVKSEQGRAIDGANVYITEMNISVRSNEQGLYRITVPPERVRGQSVMVRVRAISFQPQADSIRMVAGTITKNFELKVDINRLSEVVITGVTGATETKKLAFTVAKVDAADLPIPATNAIASLQGKITGAQIVMPSGQPGTSPAILLRGPKSINATGRDQGPLIIVDGVVLQGGLQDLNPQDIESVEVVKGAAASSTYGSRAGGGVIQITTKSGKSAAQGVRFNVRSELGVNDIADEYPFSQYHMMQMNENNTRICIKVTGYPACSRSVDFEEEALRINENGPIAALPPYNFERDYGIGLGPTAREAKGLYLVQPWPKRYNPIAQTVTLGQFSSTNLDMVGRFGNTGFFSSASNLLQEGSIKYLKGYKRNSVRLNLDQRVGDEWAMELQTFFARGTNYLGGNFFELSRAPAGASLTRRDKYGRLFIRASPMNQNSQNENPLYPHEADQGLDSQTDRYLGAVGTRYTPFPWLEIEANANLDRRRDSEWFMRDRGYRTTTSVNTASLGDISMGSGLDQSYNLGVGATARQNNPFGIRDLAMRYNARYSYEQQDNSSFEASGSTLAVPGLTSLNNATSPDNPSSSISSVRALGILGGAAAEYKERYILDGVYRVDGSSLFGADQRWHPYYRGSFAWRASEERWWPAKGVFNDFKLRASIGTAGGRPRFSAQYETFSIGTGGTVTGQALGNRNLKPETTTETEYGIDAEMFRRIGLSVTYARDITRDQIIPVPPSVSTGFSSQWKNGGTMDNKTWEVSLNIPIITNRSLVWSTRLSYDRNRSYITALDIPPFFSGGLRFAVGERIGTTYGKKFVTDCVQLPAPFNADCGGEGKSYQRNSDGYIVWTGGLSPGDGHTQNAWQATLPGCVNATTGALIAQTGTIFCEANGGRVNNPWGTPFTHWGMIIVMRDSTGTAALLPLGNSQPDFHLTMSHNVQFKRLTLYALVDGNYGNRTHNAQVQWSLGDFNVRFEDQDKATVETAKPLGYYWRAPAPEGAGVGGFYDTNSRNTYSMFKGTFTKLREMSAAYLVGPVRGVGDWTVSVIGRNLFTLTDFYGWDPENGGGGGNLNSGAIGASQGTGTYPQMRTFTLSIGTRF